MHDKYIILEFSNEKQPTIRLLFFYLKFQQKCSLAIKTIYITFPYLKINKDITPKYIMIHFNIFI